MRARNIKPSIFSNETLGTADPYLTILFEGLWCLSDREGRLEDRPLKIKAHVFPYRNFTAAKMDSLLGALAEAGFIRRYQVDGVRVIQVVKFLEHQSPHTNEKDSELPVEPVVQPHENQQDTGSREKDASDCLLAPNSSNQESENQRIRESGISLKPVEEIFDYWRTRMNHPKATLTTERRKSIKDRLAKYSVTDIKTAIDGCAKSPYHMGQNDKQTVYDDLELICRNDTKLEKFIALNDQVRPNGQYQHNPKSNLAILEQSADYFENKYGPPS